MKRPDDSGTILLLTVGYVLVALAFLLAVVDVSKVFLARRSLAATCDGAALEAAQQAATDAVYAGALPPDGPLPLDESAVRAEVTAYVGQAYPDGDATAAASTDGQVAVLDCRTQVGLPGGGLLGPRQVTVTAHAEARSPLRLP